MAEGKTEVDYLIDKDLGDNGGVLRVRKIKKLGDWVQREHDFWSWLSDPDVSQHGTLRRLVPQVMTPLSQLKGYVNQITAESDPEGNLNNFRSLLDQTYLQRKVLHSSTPEAEFIDGLRQEVGKVEAAAALAHCVGVQVDRNDIRVFRGAVSLILFFEVATRKSSAAALRSLKKLAKDYSEQYAEDTNATEKLHEQLEALVEEHTTLKERGNADMANAVKLAREQADKQREEVATQLAEFEATYDAKLALEAPVKYWRSKFLKHKTSAIWFAVLFLVYVLATTLGAIKFLPDTGLIDLVFSKEVSLGTIALTLAVLGVFVAIARVLLRLALSQLHLLNDADERVTMVNTYLALRRDGDANEEHMRIVIERLFAPVADGIVGSEIGPITAVEAFQRAIAKK